MNTKQLLAKQQINQAYQGIEGGTTGDPGTGAADTGSNIWSSSGFWGSLNHLFDTVGNMFGRPNYGAYPDPYNQPRQTIDPMITYAAVGLILLIALALVFKIIK